MLRHPRYLWVSLVTKRILALETSCDETSAAVVEDGHLLRASEISSQIDLHQVYGGVVPEIASRRHVQNIVPVLETVLYKSGYTLPEMDAVAVTYGPGLVGALLVGLSVAKALAFGLDIPLIGVNHMVAHVYANVINHTDFSFPTLCLIVSGGHTQLALMKGHLQFEQLGQTLDDAAGEAFDKIARRLGLGYPGGPIIDRLSRQGMSTAYDFPRAYLEEGSFDFSFSGLKSAVINVIHKHEQRGQGYNTADVAASFQQAVVEVLVNKTLAAAQKYGVKQVCLAGGVAANSALREQLQVALAHMGIDFRFPPPILCTDNAAMVGAAGYYYWQAGQTASLSLNAVPGLQLGE